LSAPLLTKSQASEYQDQSADASATTESQPTDNSNSKPRLDKEQYGHRERVHNSWSGHRGIDATIAMLKEKVSWKENKLCSTIYINIRYLKTNNRVVLTIIQQHKSLLRMFRNNVSSIRFSGSTDEHDNKFVMVIINKYLHALVELHPVKDFKAETIAAKLVEHFRIFSTPQ
jgi:hypothetical protein